ncbi:MAG: response regulator transcription factor [Proteobacteria bacterium]|nr:response regulator transcription factor [Pseudomonadota bacterium]
MINLLIADDHAIVREGIKKIIALSTDIVVEADAVDGPGVMEKLSRRADFDLLLLDLTMPGVVGTSLISRVKDAFPDLPILVFSMHNDAQVASRAIKAGASGFIAKDSDPEVLLDAIRRVAGGGKYIDQALAEQLAFDTLLPDQRAPHALLSNREFEVFSLLVMGKRVNDIAGQLNISNKTVSTHKLNLMVKMKMANMADLINYSIDHDLFPS